MLRGSRRLALTGRFTLLGAVVLVAINAVAQNGRPITSATPEATRAQLTHRLDSLVHDSTKGNTRERRDRQSEIAALRTRLAQGDFQPSDRFVIDYGDPTRRPDTVMVRDSGNVSLLNWPAYSLHGVLQSELQGVMEKYVGTYVREPRIRVYPLTRLSFSGGVGRPGSHMVDPTRSLSDALMEAGGFTQFAKQDKVEIYRANKRLMNDKQVAQAIRDGATVEELGLQPGDEVRVPESKQNYGMTRYTVQEWLFGISIVTAIIAFIRASYVP